MPAKKMTVHAKAKKALPDSANRPKTKVAGSTKKNTRMRPVLSEQKAKGARAKSTTMKKKAQTVAPKRSKTAKKR